MSNDLAAATKPLGLSPVKGMTRTFFGVVPRTEVDSTGLLAVLLEVNPSPRMKGRFFWTITINASPAGVGSGTPDEIASSVHVARLMYEKYPPV